MKKESFVCWWNGFLNFCSQVLDIFNSVLELLRITPQVDHAGHVEAEEDHPYHNYKLGKKSLPEGHRNYVSIPCSRHAGDHEVECADVLVCVSLINVGLRI